VSPLVCLSHQQSDSFDFDQIITLRSHLFFKRSY
jgi:hypothetical protein